MAAGAVAAAGEATAEAQSSALLAAPAIDMVRIECLREGQPTDMNVSDAAALSAVVELSARSAGRRASPVDVPDFTRGRWKTTPPLDIVHM